MEWPYFQQSSPTYVVCGLRVRSDRVVPDLAPAEFDYADVEIAFLEHSDYPLFGRQTLRYSSNALSPNGEPAVRLFEIADPCFSYQLAYADGTKFLIDRAGSRVCATWAVESTFEDILTYLLGPVLGFLLRLRGVVSLHASAIAMDSMAVVLTGPAGAGKSTAAAQFSAMGYPILSDDIATVIEDGSSLVVEPGPARLRLWPPSVEHLYGYPDALPRLTPSWEKRYLDLRTGCHRFQPTRLRLGAIYVLSNTENPAEKVVGIPCSAAMLQLMSNVYVNYLLDDSFRRRDFVRIARVLNTVSVRSVKFRHDFATLERTCRFILADFDDLRDRTHEPQIACDVSRSSVSFFH